MSKEKEKPRSEKEEQRFVKVIDRSIKPWLDLRLSKEIMDHLWVCINGEQTDAKWDLAGNISKSKFIKDRNNLFFSKTLQVVTEYHYCRDSWTNYFEIKVAKSKPLPEFVLDTFWVNYQKQYEFNPPHQHSDGTGFSFVVFMKIPTHWKEQHALPISANSNSPCASDFQFLLGQENKQVAPTRIHLSPEDEGRMLFFPAWVSHQVFPFYECEEERITVSGNIVLKEVAGEVWHKTDLSQVDPVEPEDQGSQGKLTKR